MGLILERSGLAEDLLDTIGQLFGPIRGGLAYAVVFVGALLAATTGVVAASVLAMGLISLPVMMRYGYSKRLATGVIAASGTLAQIIPPSLVLIVLADQMGASVGDLYEGALVPGLTLAAFYAVYVLVVSIVKPEAAPALPPWRRARCAAARCWLMVFTSLVPPLVLIFLVLGTIFLGVATPTEGGAMGASGAIIMALIKRKLSWSLLRQAVESTATMTSFVIFILVGSTVFSLVFRGVNGDLWVEHLLTGLPGGALGFLIVVNVMIFFLAFFLDYFEIAFIMVPLLAPVAQKLGIDLIWFGVLLAVNMQTSFLHPPFGFALFYLRSVRPEGHQDHGHLLGRGAVRLHPGPDGGDRDRVPGHRHQPRVEGRRQLQRLGRRRDAPPARQSRRHSFARPRRPGDSRPARPRAKMPTRRSTACCGSSDRGNRMRKPRGTGPRHRRTLLGKRIVEAKFSYEYSATRCQRNSSCGISSTARRSSSTTGSSRLPPRTARTRPCAPPS